jgi:hypothetical protein
MDQTNAMDSDQVLPRPQSFTVIIPRSLQPVMSSLPSEVRQQVLSELFRVAALTTQERAGQLRGYTYATRLEVAGCTACVEMDDERSRLMLTGLVWNEHDA